MQFKNKFNNFHLPSHLIYEDATILENFINLHPFFRDGEMLSHHNKPSLEEKMDAKIIALTKALQAIYNTLDEDKKESVGIALGFLKEDVGV